VDPLFPRFLRVLLPDPEFVDPELLVPELLAPDALDPEVLPFAAAPLVSVLSDLRFRRLFFLVVVPALSVVSFFIPAADPVLRPDVDVEDPDCPAGLAVLPALLL
jgi:hypothetical protein